MHGVKIQSIYNSTGDGRNGPLDREADPHPTDRRDEP